MVLRTWDLGQPFGMIFDEVYHARTATEFLQDWRYGEPHDIYEFTHPHLAKYLIAVGLVAFGDDNVTGTADLGGPVTDAVVETRWSPPDQPDQRDGDRLYTATTSGVVAYDLATRQAVATIALGQGRVPVHLAVDDGAHVLYVADDTGGLWTIQTADLDALRTSSSAPAPTATSLGTFGAPVASLELSSDGAHAIAITTTHQLVSLATADGSRAAAVADPSAAALVAVPADTGAGAVAVAEGDALDLRDAATLVSSTNVVLPEAPTGLVLMNGLDQPTIYAAGDSDLTWISVPAVGWPDDQRHAQDAGSRARRGVGRVVQHHPRPGAHRGRQQRHGVRGRAARQRRVRRRAPAVLDRGHGPRHATAAAGPGPPAAAGPGRRPASWPWSTSATTPTPGGSWASSPAPSCWAACTCSCACSSAAAPSPSSRPRWSCWTACSSPSRASP